MGRWWASISGQVLLLLVLAVLLSGLGVALLMGFVMQTELALVLKSLPDPVRQAFEGQWKALVEHTDPALDFDLPWWVLLLLLLPWMVLLALVGWVQQKLTVPLHRVSLAARKVAEGKLEVQLEVPAVQSGEVAQLQQDFNHMASALLRLKQERQATTAALAHELRTPISVLQARLQASADGVLPLDGGATQVLLEQARLLGRLVNDLQLLSLAGAGALEVQLQTADLTEWMKGWQTTALLDARAHGLNLELLLPAQPCWVLLDPDRFQQVMHNLLRNACLHAPQHSILWMEMQVLDTEVHLRVTDQGKGIPAGEEEQIFRRFYRTDPSRSRHSGGSGLGLSVVQAVVDLHHGRVWAENRPAGGACFTVALPLQP